MLDREVRFTFRKLMKWWLFPPVCAGLVMLATFGTVYAKWTTTAVAAWVQAIGSVAAIIAAIWIANAQNRREEAKVAANQEIAVIMIKDVARRAIRQAEVLEELVHRRRPSVYVHPFPKVDTESVAGLYFELKGFDLTTIGRPEIVTELLHLRGVFEAGLESFRVANEAPYSSERIGSALET